MNLYQLCYNNPVNRIDTDNEIAPLIVAAGVAFFLGYEAANAQTSPNEYVEPGGTGFVRMIASGVTGAGVNIGVGYARNAVTRAASARKIQCAVDAVEDFLGEPGEILLNPKGDPIIMKGGMKIRFDINSATIDPHFILNGKHRLEHGETRGHNTDTQWESSTMKWVANCELELNRCFEIEFAPPVGYYLYVYKEGRCIMDYLQDTFEIAVDMAFEDFGVQKDSWRLEEE